MRAGTSSAVFQSLAVQIDALLTLRVGSSPEHDRAGKWLARRLQNLDLNFLATNYLDTLCLGS
jgi:hypothetical protein